MALSYWIACVNIGLIHFADVADEGLGMQVAMPAEASANDPFTQGRQGRIVKPFACQAFVAIRFLTRFITSTTTQMMAKQEKIGIVTINSQPLIPKA